MSCFKDNVNFVIKLLAYMYLCIKHYFVILFTKINFNFVILSQSMKVKFHIHVPLVEEYTALKCHYYKEVDIIGQKASK